MNILCSEICDLQIAQERKKSVFNFITTQIEVDRLNMLVKREPDGRSQSFEIVVMLLLKQLYKSIVISKIKNIKVLLFFFFHFVECRMPRYHLVQSV